MMILKGDMNRYNILMKLVRKFVRQHETILEIGSYPAVFTSMLEKEGYSVEGIDLHPERINPQIRKKIVFKKCDVENQTLPYKNNHFDVIIFVAILEHMRINPLVTLKELRRVLKPGGRLILQTPNLSYWTRRLKVLFGRSFDESPYRVFDKLQTLGHAGHIRDYTMKEACEILKESGFLIFHKQWDYIAIPPKKLLHWFDLIIGLYPPFRNQLTIIATKR